MPGTRTDISQMFDHELNIRRGDTIEPGSRLEKALPVAGGQNNLVNAGCVMFVNSENLFDLGVNPTGDASLLAVPYFAANNQNDSDVNPAVGNMAGGVINGICGLGDFELETTEFDPEQTYAVGTPLTSATGAGDPNTSDGLLTPGVVGTNVIVGIVSEVGSNANGSYPNEHGKDIIRFVTWYMPEFVSVT